MSDVGVYSIPCKNCKLKYIDEISSNIKKNNIYMDTNVTLD